MTELKDGYLVCPKCGKKIVEILKSVQSYYDPNFNHSCGFNKPLSWERPKKQTRKKI